MDSEFRELTGREQALLERLLDSSIYGSDELRTQLPGLTAKQIEDDGTLLLLSSGGIGVSGKYAPVAEGTCKDVDGSDITVMLHLGSGGFMSMLEIIKDDGSEVIKPPSAEDLVLLLPEDPGRAAS